MFAVGRSMPQEGEGESIKRVAGDSAETLLGSRAVPRDVAYQTSPAAAVGPDGQVTHRTHAPTRRRTRVRLGSLLHLQGAPHDRA